jgi:hypothetical protein
MSLLHKAIATCQSCAAETAVRYAASVNADRRPDLRAAILDGSFQSEACPGCGARLRLPAQLTYLDLAFGQWIIANPAEALAQWPAEEAYAVRIFERSFGAEAPEAAREIGREVTPRVVFGWPALREKILCTAFQLDDTILELLKIAVLRNVSNPPLEAAAELRLTGRDGAELELTWMNAVSEKQVANLMVPGGIYDDIAVDLTPWAGLSARVRGSMFVDMQRLLIDGA